MSDLRYLGRRPAAPAPPNVSIPDWKQCDPGFLQRSLAHALGKSAGGWFVLGARRSLGHQGPEKLMVDGHELVLWRVDGRPLVAPAACPHLGADLSCGRVDGTRLVCPWHGLRLSARGRGRWRPVPIHDDGVLLWVMLPVAGETPTDAPVLAPRPPVFLDGVVRMEAHCAPEDVIANRLDPWHGVHFHPHSFATLQVLEAREDRLTLRVAYRVIGRLAVEVDATFHCPDRRTIVMTIIGGEGVGSVVETHATPIEPGRTAVIEATLATSERPGFRKHASKVAALARPFIEARAARLWLDDVAYAERRYALRCRRDDAPSAVGAEPAEAGTSRGSRVHLRTA